MTRSARACIGMAAAAVVALAGCGDDSSSSETAGGPAAAAATAEAPSWLAEAEAATAEATRVPTEIASAKLGKFTPKPGASIFYINCDMAVEGCANQYRATAKAAEVLGYDIELCDGKFAADTAMTCFTNAVNANPDVIVTNGLGRDLVPEGIEAAKKAGIPVVGSFTPNKEGINEDANVAFDNGTTQGELIADWVIADSGGNANVLWLGETALSVDVQRKAAFEERMAACESCDVSDIQFTNTTLQTTLPQQLQAELQSNPDINYIVGTFDGAALVATDAVRSAGKADSIKVAGMDGNAPNMELVKKDDIQKVDLTTGTTEPGWAVADVVARLYSGEDVPKDVPVTNVLVTPQNIGEVGLQYVGPPNLEEQFKELWNK